MAKNNPRAYLGWRERTITEEIGREAFYHYHVEMGTAKSYTKLASYFNGKGIRNPETGKPLQAMSYYHGMWKWALLNIDEAKEVYRKFKLQFGENLDEEWWRKYIKMLAKRYFNKKKLQKFFTEHPEYKI